MIKEKPILFSGEMVRAILSGAKTQTRRVMKPQPAHDGQLLQWKDCQWHEGGIGFPESGIADHAPYRPGDRLWVRESRIRPSIHMPRWASRILLEVTDVRVERLNDITEDDAIAEGISILVKDGKGRIKWEMPDHVRRTGEGEDISDDVIGGWTSDPVEAYRAVWSAINGSGSWESNPWVWVVSFKMLYGK